MYSGGAKNQNLYSISFADFWYCNHFFLFRTLSIQVLEDHAYDDLTRIIYLPAGIRLLAVAIYSWIGILGIMLGWVFCYLHGEERTLLESLNLGLVSGATAYASFLVWRWYYKINSALEGLTSKLAISLVLISAVISAFIRYVYLNSVDPITPFLTVFMIGFCGDILGSFIVLYAMKGGIYVFRRLSIT